MRRQLRPRPAHGRSSLTVLCGLAYPLAMTGVAQALFADKADGSLIERDGEVVGSSLVGQAFSAPEYFHTRPSAAGALASGSLVGRRAGRPDRPVASPRAVRRTRARRTPTCSPPSRSGPPPTARSTAWPTTWPCRSTPSPRRLGRRPAHLRRQRPPPGAPASPTSAGLDRRRGARPGRRPHRRPVARASWARRASTCSSSTSPSTSSRLSGRTLRPWRGARCASTSVPRRASARPSPCSTRAGAGVERGTDVVVGYVETHGRRRHRGPGRRASRWSRAARSSTGARRSRRWTSTARPRPAPAVALVDELAHTNAPGSRARRSAGRTSRSCATRASTSSPRSTSSTSSRSTTSSSGSPGVKQRETIPDEVARGADQVELVDMAPGGAAPAHGPRQHLRAGEGRRRPRQLLPARQPRRAARAGPHVGGRPGRRRAPGLQGQPTGSSSTWETRERVVVARHRRAERRAADPAGGPHGQRGRAATCSACTCSPSDGLAEGPSDLLRRAPDAARGPRRRRTTRSSGPTSPPRSPTSPAPRTPPSSCSARAAGRGGPSSSAGRSSTTSSTAPAASTSTSSARSRVTTGPARGPRRGAPAAPRRVAPSAASRLARRGWSASRCSRSRWPTSAARSACRATCCCTCCSSWSAAAVGGVGPAAAAAVARVPLRELVLHAAVPPAHDRPRARTRSPSWSSSWSGRW